MHKPTDSQLAGRAAYASTIMLNQIPHELPFASAPDMPRMLRHSRTFVQ